MDRARRLPSTRVALALGTLLLLAMTAPPSPGLAAPSPVSTTNPTRDLEPVIVTGAQLPDWSAGPEVAARAPQAPTNYSASDCYNAKPTPDVNGYTDPYNDDHNCFEASQSPVRTAPGRTGIDPASLRGFKWTGKAFEQIPFQVDTKWQHYLSNNASGFAVYSGADAELTYTYDREGFQNTNAPFDPQHPERVCQAIAAPPHPDPNAGLIDTDEMAFMYRDSGSRAPAGTPSPSGIAATHELRITDPLTGNDSWVYLMSSARQADGKYAVPVAFTAAKSPYIHYQRDSDADLFVYSQSNYSNYGNARFGPACNRDGRPVIGQGFKRLPSGLLVLDPTTYVQRRPLDTATVTTPRYLFRYDGRWLMDRLQVSNRDLTLGNRNSARPAAKVRAHSGTNGNDAYLGNLADRFKARAFQQTPGGQTPCCGYEEEQTNWEGSSITMGERVGPVRVIRSTWGADSSTNNVRTEIFYPYEIRYVDHLRVHVIPPLDGIYVQRDMAAGAVTTYSNPYVPQGVPVNGISAAVFGKFKAHVGPDGAYVDSQDQLGDATRQANGGQRVSAGAPNDATCSGSGCVHGNFDAPDYTFSGPPGLLQWEELDGPQGALVERWNVSQVSAGAAYGLVTEPYYRDDSCFDDGTGSDPGPRVRPRSADEPTTWGYDPRTGQAVSPAPAGALTVYQRRCWNHHTDGTPYNLPGTTHFDPSKPTERPDSPPDPRFSPQGDVRYFQGDIGTHGLHVLMIADSDNAFITAPVDEIDVEMRQVILHGGAGPVGEQYGHSFDKPLVAQPLY